MGLDIDEDVVDAICLAETVLYCVRGGGGGGGQKGGMVEATCNGPIH